MDNKQKFQNYMLDLIKKGECGSYKSRCRNFEFWDSLQKIIETITQKNIFQVNSTNELENILRILKRNLDWKRFNAGHQNGIPDALLNKHYRHFISNNTNLTLKLENPQTNENKSSDLDKLREELIRFGESLNSERFDRNDGQSTVLKVKNSYDKQFVAVHFDNANKNGVRIRLSNKYVSEKLKNRTEIENYEKNFNLKFLIKSVDDLSIAKELIKNSIENAIEIENNFTDIYTLIRKYQEFKNSSQYDEEYKWNYALKNLGIFEDLNNLSEKLSQLGSPNFQTYFIKNSGIKWFSKNFPEELQNSFKILFDENIELKDRIRKFREIIKTTLDNDEGWGNKTLTESGVDTASFYLFTNNYKKYLLFARMTPFNNYAKKLGLESLLKYETQEERYINWQNYCQQELIPIMNDVLNKETDLLDAQDFIWFVGNEGNNTIGVEVALKNLREELLQYGESLGARQEELSSGYTALKVFNSKNILRNAVDIHKIRNNRIQIDVLDKFVPDELKEKVNITGSQTQTLNNNLFVKSEEDMEDAKKLIKNAIEKTSGDFSTEKFVNEEFQMRENYNNPLNQILYGPPGTGKTYETRKIIKNILQEQVDRLNNQHLSSDEIKIKEVVENLTWYEVIALAMYRKNKDAFHKVVDIVKSQEMQTYVPLKNNQNPKSMIWAMLQTHTGLDSNNVSYKSRLEPFLFEKTEDSNWYLTENGKRYIEEDLADALDKLKKPKAYKLEDFYKFITFHQSYSYEEFVEGLKPEIHEETGNITYNLENGIFKDICKDARRDMDKGLKYVLVIDEINRGNISKIFGELITLIEDTKRIKLNPKEDDEGLEVTLPYSKKLFGVPENLYIVGTMNTADRSIALLDIALRRRFDFVPKYPDSSVIKDIDGEIAINGINLEEFLNAINDRIEVLYDRDHTIGHSYLMGLNNYSDFLRAFNNKILPLLQEYFYNDYEKIAKVLNQSDFEENETAIIHRTEIMGISKFNINTNLQKTDKFPSDAFIKASLNND